MFETHLSSKYHKLGKAVNVHSQWSLWTLVSVGGLQIKLLSDPSLPAHWRYTFAHLHGWVQTEELQTDKRQAYNHIATTYKYQREYSRTVTWSFSAVTCMNMVLQTWYRTDGWHADKGAGGPSRDFQGINDWYGSINHCTRHGTKHKVWRSFHYLQYTKENLMSRTCTSYL